MAKQKKRGATKSPEAVSTDASKPRDTGNAESRDMPSKNAPSTSHSSASSPAPDTGKTKTVTIPRGKAWRQETLYQGPWTTTTINVLDALSHMNSHAPKPHPFDDALLFDLVKIRRLYEDASELASKADCAVGSSTLTTLDAGSEGHMNLSYLSGYPPGQQSSSGRLVKLSSERKFKMREQASQKLSRAYHLDENATSSVALTEASPVDDIGAQVLRRKPDDMDARYIHFFHEKISCLTRDFGSHKPLEIIGDIAAHHPGVLRTRAKVKTMAKDLDGALQDLTQAITQCRLQSPHHGSLTETEKSQYKTSEGEEKPSGLEDQLLFYRAKVYLELAREYAVFAVGENPSPASKSDTAGQQQQDIPDPAKDDAAAKERLDNAKIVKSFAKKAVRGLLEYLSCYEYSPNQPIKVAEFWNDKLNFVIERASKRYWNNMSTSVEPLGRLPTYRVYPLSHLFSAVPPTDLPPFPAPEMKHDEANNGSSSKKPPRKESCEVVSFHPLLSNALHSLLIAHTLAQTSQKEIQRHAYMVARLIRLLDGYPILSPPRCPTRAEWVDILNRGDNWLGLESSWNVLCRAAPLPFAVSKSAPQEKCTCCGEALHESPLTKQYVEALTSAKRSIAAAQVAKQTTPTNAASQATPASKAESDAITEGNKEKARSVVNELRRYYEEGDRSRFKTETEAMDAALENDDVTGHLVEALEGLDTDTKKLSAMSDAVSAGTGSCRWNVESSAPENVNEKRTVAVARWVKEVPLVTGIAKRKKRAVKKVTDYNEREIEEELGQAQ